MWFKEFHLELHDEHFSFPHRIYVILDCSLWIRQLTSGINCNANCEISFYVRDEGGLHLNFIFHAPDLPLEALDGFLSATCVYMFLVHVAATSVEALLTLWDM